MPVENVHYYILSNGVHETTGGQVLPSFPFVPGWCNIIKMDTGQEGTPNPPSPSTIMANCQNWLNNNADG